MSLDDLLALTSRDEHAIQEGKATGRLADRQRGKK